MKNRMKKKKKKEKKKRREKIKQAKRNIIKF